MLLKEFKRNKNDIDYTMIQAQSGKVLLDRGEIRDALGFVYENGEREVFACDRKKSLFGGFNHVNIYLS
jgi:hypothetical protein